MVLIDSPVLMHNAHQIELLVEAQLPAL